MTIFEVTTAVTAYETYTVEAVNEEAACALVRHGNRGEMPSHPSGFSDDEIIIACRERGSRRVAA